MGYRNTSADYFACYNKGPYRSAKACGDRRVCVLGIPRLKNGVTGACTIDRDEWYVLADLKGPNPRTPYEVWEVAFRHFTCYKDILKQIVLVQI